jgi:peptide/nickel transport system ATP-binding protein
MATAVATGKLLEVNNLSVDYLAGSGTVHAVTDVSFTLERGKVLGLAGESGSGKSTLAYAISRLLRPPALITGGEVIYHPPVLEKSNGTGRGHRQLKNEIWDTGAPIDILQCSAEQLRAFRWNTMSVVFQSAMNALNPVMNIGAQITDVLRAHRPEIGPDARQQRALELLKLVGIAPDRIKSYPHELSGGMRQRAVIAIALALSPEIIIMDEPTTALDVVVQREILTEILHLREEFGFSVIFITHDLSLLLELADNIAIMYAGRIVEYASQYDLYSRPCHPYSYGLLNSFPTLHGPRRTMSGIPGSPPDLRAIPSGCSFHPRCPLAFAPCNQVLPTLSPVPAQTSGRSVACHLYDSRFRAEPPTTAEIATHYEALAMTEGESEA